MMTINHDMDNFETQFDEDEDTALTTEHLSSTCKMIISVQSLLTACTEYSPRDGIQENR